MAEDYKPDINSFTPNSHISKEEKKEKKIEKVITGKVVAREQSTAKKLVHLFFENDINDVKDYLLYDLVIARIKDTIFDIFEVLWKGENRARVSSVNTPRISYNKQYKIVTSSNQQQRTSKTDSRNFREIIFESRQDAEAVRNDLFDIITDYGCVSIGDLYDMVGEKGTFADQKYGWFDISDSTIKRALGGGYLLSLPPATLLD